MTLVWQNSLSKGCPKGKIASQVSHAAVALILQLMKDVCYPDIIVKLLEIKIDSPLDQWIYGKFTKTVVRVESESELLEVYNKAKEAGLNTVLIEDCGDTVFGGVRTRTVVGLGPDDSDKIDKITGHLKLL